MLSPENRGWLDEFRKTHGRSPRILHVGNIANNAYNNAKILNEAGLDNYVICYDYYHIMGCPEWEDADFSEFVGDHFRPQWFRFDLRAFRRPKWFIQAPFDLCFQTYEKASLAHSDASRLQSACLEASGCIPPKAVSRSTSRGHSLRVALCSRALKRLWPIRVRGRLLRRRWRFHRLRFRRCFRLQLYCLARKVRPHRRTRWLARRTLAVLLRQPKIPHAESSVDEKATFKEILARSLAASFFEEFRSHCHANKSQKRVGGSLSYKDFLIYFGALPRWEKHVFSNADYIVAYSTDPIIPMLCGRDYFAFEHGTIRDIPYQDSTQGRLTALAYRKARHVFVTNFDCRSSAEFLAPGRFTMINHPFDEDHGQKIEGRGELRAKLCHDLDSSFLIFHPTRHDWVQGTGYADKSNDVLLRAFCNLRAQGLRLGMVCCDWGKNVAESKRLIEDRGFQKFVKWVQPLPVVAFERTCLACDLVADQFMLGSFGGVVFKAMAVGRPILTFLDESRVREQYSECPPVLNCRTETEIEAGVAQMVADPSIGHRIGAQSREWIVRHHGKASTVNAQVDQFRLLGR